ncbi:MAG: tRNA lysidine(34) synthetase TilS [Bacteroidota bacterium]
MLDDFKNFLLVNKLIDSNQKVLVTVSGGIDSMVMAHLFLKSGIGFEIAHCNFNLRGTESDNDELFVQDFCYNNNIKCHCKRFETLAYAEKNKISTQMAARELRYTWFNELCQTNHIDLIATAHHQNDVAETMLINMVKGTGIAGIHGILAKQSNIIRPLLFSNKNEIIAFANTNHISYREDSSNLKDTYWRNKIRHHVLPIFQELNQNSINAFYELSKKIHENEFLLNEKLNELKDKYTKTINGVVHIDKVLLQHVSAKTILHFIIDEYGFNEANIEQIAASKQPEIGSCFLSRTHELLVDRDSLIISAKTNTVIAKNITVNEETNYIHTDAGNFEVTLINKVPAIYAKNCFYIDADLAGLSFTLRNKLDGDKFIPLGMKGKKLVSDYLIDKKINRFEKDVCLVMESTDTNDIICVLPYQINDKYKLSISSKLIIEIKYRPN